MEAVKEIVPPRVFDRLRDELREGDTVRVLADSEDIKEGPTFIRKVKKGGVGTIYMIQLDGDVRVRLWVGDYEVGALFSAYHLQRVSK